MIYICNKCGNEVETTMKFCRVCGNSLLNNTISISGYEERINNPVERKILYIIKRELEEKYPKAKIRVQKTCESYTTLFIDDDSIIRLEKLINAIEISFRLSDKKREEYRFTNKFHWFNEKDAFWSICTRDTDLSIFDEFIDDAVNNHFETERILKEKRKEKLAKKKK